MASARVPWVGEEEDIPGRNQLKTYLVEAHTPGDGRDRELNLLKKVGQPLGAFVRPTEDPSLLRLSYTSNDADFWCDTSLNRFWRIHTTAKVDVADNLLGKLINSSPWLDNVWIPPRYLRDLPSHLGGRMQTFSLRHDRRQLRPASHFENHEDNGDLDFVTLRLWASEASLYLSKLQKTQIFPHSLSMRSVRLEAGKAENQKPLCVAEYFHHGKVTVSGQSFDEHNRLLLLILQHYKELVEGIERDYAFGLEPEGSRCPHLTGDPITIDLEWTVDDIEYAVAKMFSCGEPFRLWGIPEKLPGDCYRARAVDLHVGSTLTFDIMRDKIVIQLPRGTCGNTIVRFLGNLQANVNADAVGPFST